MKNLVKTHNYSDTIVLPSSILEVEPTLETRTLLASRIARILGAFQVDELVIYNSSRQRLFKEFCTIMKYLVLPPYLKKYMPKQKALSKIGIAYPLNIAIHMVEKNPENDPIRLGLVIGKKRGGLLIDVGLNTPLTIDVDVRKYRKGDIVLVDLNKMSILRNHNYYVGFRITCIDTMDILVHYMDAKKMDGYVFIGTSVRGEDHRACRSCHMYKRVFFYGDPKRGVDKLYKGIVFDEVINILVGQGTTTLRTDEALCISLSRLHK